uniref:Reverse transcriptase domain-containing protein n=1 Tax=Tanacetum cinerariifolium TaxID=118510 RepID=A0A6L2P5W1_TANCI|nr:reverse transcriptase domain-containing protein [Tanacetum cinerariifolium]
MIDTPPRWETTRQAAKAQNWKLLVCYDDDDDEERSNSLKDNIISGLPPCAAITPILSTEEPVDSFIMEDEHLNTIPATESDKFIKSSVENLVPNPSEPEGEHECDVPACEVFTTFSNILFDADYDFYSSDEQSFSDEDFPKEIYSNPLFDEEIISMKIDPHHFNVESDLIESLLNYDSSIISSSKIDSLFDEFAGELTLLKSIPPGIAETDCDPEEETHFIKRLLYDNSSPRPPEEFVSENSDAACESFSPLPIPEEEKQIEEEQATNARYWKILVCYDDDDDGHTFAITPNKPDNSLNFSSSDDKSFSDENISKEIYSNPLFSEEIISTKIDPHHFNAESDLIESLLNHDSSINSSSKIDSLLDEFAGELILLNDSLRDEIDLSLTPDDSMPPSIEDDDYDSERDMLVLEELLSNDSFSLPENESFHFDIPSSTRPPAKPPDDDEIEPNSGILTIKVAYENSLIYKERTKKLHDAKIKNHIFNVGDQVLLFNSRLKIFSDGKPLTCSGCEGMLRGGFCLPCNLKAGNSYNSYQDAYSFNDLSNNSNYLPQPQYENYLCNLCGNNSHDGYDCQQQFPFVYEQEPSYNQNYDGNYYPYESPSFPCCDNCGESHETFQCQPMAQNIDFSGSDQIQTPQYPEVHPPSPEQSDEYSKPENPNELFQKLLEDLKELAEYEKSQSKDHPIFLNDNEEHSEIPPQDSDIRKLIREECCVEVSEEQKQNMEDTMLELVKICRQKELLCIHDNVEDLIESAFNSKLLSINSQRLEKEQQEVKNVVEQPAERGNRIESLQNFRVIRKSSISLNNTSQISSIHAVAPILSTEEPEYSSSMGYENSNTTPETESDEIMKSGVEELVPILTENKVTLEDKRECDMPVCEDSSASDACDDHSDIFSDSKDDDDISSDDDDFEDIEYVEASLPDHEIVSVEEENVVYQEEEEVDLEEISQIQDIVLHEKLLSITRLISNIESLNDNPIPDLVLNSSVSDNPSVPQPPPKPPDAKTDAGEEIPVVMNDKDKFDED